LVIAPSSPGGTDAGSVLLKNELDDYFDQGVEQIVFDNGTVWTRSDLRLMYLAQAATAGNDIINGFNVNDTLTGGPGDDTLNGGSGNDTYVYNRGDGNDNITETTNNGNADQLVLHGITTSAVSLVRNGNDVTLVIAPSSAGASDGGSILLKGNLINYFDQGVEQIVFDSGTVWTRAQLIQSMIGTLGNDALTGTSGNDTFYSSPGVDTLSGAGGFDIYKIGQNTGQTTINNLASDGVTTANGEIDFGAGIASSQLWFQQSGNNLQIDLLGTTETVTVAGWFGGNARAQTQSFDTADGSKLDTQVAQLVSAMATYSSANPGFNPTTATQMPADSGVQNAVAAAWHH
jgi:Ca2+-binding RTX toxin-like protein